MLIIVANWVFIVEHNFSKFRLSKEEFQEQYNDYNNEISNINEKISEVKIQDLKGDSSAYLKIVQPLREDVQEVKAKKDTLVKNKDENFYTKAIKVHDLQSLIEFTFYICNDTKNGPVILNLLILALCFYLFLTRRICLKYVSKAIRIYKIEPTLKINKYQDFNLKPPFWLVPLPSKGTSDITPSEIKTIFGWGFTHGYLRFFSFIVLTLLIILQSRICLITFIVNSSKINLNFIVSAVSVLSLVMVVLYWLLPFKIEDNFNYEKNPNSFSRKDFIALSSFTVFSIAFAKFAYVLPKYIHNRVPRFRINKIKLEFLIPNFKSSLVKNKKSNIVHYINSKGFSQTLHTISSSNELDKFSSHIETYNEIASLKTNHEKPRMPIRHSTWHSESLAIESIQLGNFTVAVDILIYSIKQGIDNYSPKYRLHDLLALLCVRYKTKIPNDVLRNLIELSNNTKDKKLIERAKKWSNNEWIHKIGKKQKVAFNNITI